MNERRFIKGLAAAFFVLLFFWGGLAQAQETAADDLEGEVSRILDRSTVFHWGADSLVWIVHYPRELEDPWVRLEAKRNKMNAQQAEEYRKQFAKDLRSDTTDAFVLSVHAFGASPLNLAPLSKNVALITADGKRVPPVSYEKKLDAPLAGLTQGFVFFPKQPDVPVQVAVRGLIPGKETVFKFARGSALAASPEAPSSKINTGAAKASGQKDSDKKEVLLKIPDKPDKPASPKDVPKIKTEPAKPQVPKAPPENKEAAKSETFTPTNPAISAVSDDPNPLWSERAAPESEDVAASAPAQEWDPKTRTRMEQALKRYLTSWKLDDTKTMYSMLSAESRQKIDFDAFEKSVRANPFRRVVRDDYKVSWKQNTATVTGKKKILFVNTLVSEKFALVEENGQYRVSW